MQNIDQIVQCASCRDHTNDTTMYQYVLQERSESIMNLNLKLLFGFQYRRNETSRKYTILWPAQFQNVQGRGL